MTLKTLLFAGMALAFAALLGAAHYTPRFLLSHIVVLDAERLALRYLRDLEDAFDLPGDPVPRSGLARWKAEALLGVDRSEARSFDLFDTARYASDATSQAVRGYVVLNRFGDRILSAGSPVHRSLNELEAKTRFEAARSQPTIRSYDVNDAADAPGVLISVVVPLVRNREFMGVVMIDIHRNGVESGIAKGIERSIFALVALVACIALGLLLLIAVLRVQSARAQRRAAYLSRFDPLTELHNREAFLSLLGLRIRRDGERKRHFATVLIDIRRFGWINDTFGDLVGDAVLQEFAARLDRVLRLDPQFAQCGAKAARLGADEFAAVFSCDTRDQLERVSASLARICEEPIVVQDVRLDVDAAFGAALFPFDGETIDELQASVRYALEVAKEDTTTGDGTGCVRVFDTDIAAAHRRRRKLLQDVEGALKGGQMQVHYQPQVRVEAGGTHLTGFEALLRWQHPEEGFVSPAEFIPLAEQSGIIRELGAWCLHEAMQEAASWTQEPAPTVAVNVSPAQFVDDMPGHPGLVASVAEALAKTGLPPERLELEITEGLPLGEAEAILNGLEALGVGLALDDFGTGYSSLSYLAKIPVGKVKLDRAFVLRMAEDERVRAIVQAVTTMCDGMGMCVLAEGVETVAEQELLAELGCHHVQGYLHGRPTREPLLELGMERMAA